MNPPTHQRSIQVAAAAVMVKGIKADFHAEKNALKRSKCQFDAGFDVYPDRCEPKVTQLAGVTLFTIGTSVNFCFPVGTYGYLVERSSSLEKLVGARVKPGIFDAGYVGECLIQVVCRFDDWEQVMAAIQRAQLAQLAIAQMLVLPCLMPVFSKWDDKLIPPGRGSNGFGSTDIIT